MFLRTKGKEPLGESSPLQHKQEVGCWLHCIFRLSFHDWKMVAPRRSRHHADRFGQARIRWTFPHIGIPQVPYFLDFHLPELSLDIFKIAPDDLRPHVFWLHNYLQVNWVVGIRNFYCAHIGNLDKISMNISEPREPELSDQILWCLYLSTRSLFAFVSSDSFKPDKNVLS